MPWPSHPCLGQSGFPRLRQRHGIAVPPDPRIVVAIVVRRAIGIRGEHRVNQIHVHLLFSLRETYDPTIMGSDVQIALHRTVATE